MRKTLVILLVVLSLFVILTAVKSQEDSLINLYSDGHWEWTNGTPTPLVYTATPGPTWTPWVVTATQSTILTDTPTPDIFTPTPTNTPDPLCLVQNTTGGGIRVRNLPSTTNTITVGTVENGAYIHPAAYYIGPTYRWYKIWWDDVIYVWTAANFYTYISGDCEGLLYEDPFELSAFIVGLHVTNGNRTSLTNFQLDMNAAGYLSGTANYVADVYCYDSMNKNNTCRMRWPDDCPANIGVADPVAAAERYMQLRNNAVQTLKAWTVTQNKAPLLIIELTNECNWEPYEWWVPFFNTVLDYADSHDWPKTLAIPGLGPGYGNYVMFTTWRGFLQRNYERGGYLSMHNYAPIAYCGGDGSLANGNIYCAFRHRLNYEIIQDIGYNIRILVTEASPTDGYQPITIATIKDIGKYTCMIKNDAGLAGIYYWNVGDFAPFADANLGPWLPSLAESIRKCGDM